MHPLAQVMQDNKAFVGMAAWGVSKAADDDPFQALDCAMRVRAHLHSVLGAMAAVRAVARPIVLALRLCGSCTTRWLPADAAHRLA